MLSIILFLFSGQFQELLKVKDTGAELIGSFTVEIGEQDEASKLNGLIDRLCYASCYNQVILCDIMIPQLKMGWCREL